MHKENAVSLKVLLENICTLNITLHYLYGFCQNSHSITLGP